LSDPRLLRATRLTAPDDRLRELADRLGAGQPTPAELASEICAGVHSAMTYEFGVTSVRTTAAEALAGGRGVCQDSAHIMLALCHLLGLPARYVSGHLLGQGGTHAWVEVVIRRGACAVALPLDPCNGVPGTARYLTVATGRDYAGVRPTSGSYLGAASGQLNSTRRVAVLAAA
jgi:transglutaminase-like putative cysteine protease